MKCVPKFAVNLSMLLALTGTSMLAQAQLALNEVFENPPNGGDQTWEYIELIGPPGFDLSGYAVVLVKGGQDFNPEDGIPDGSTNQRGAEIDEGFALDGWSIGPDGLFVIYNQADFGFTGLDLYLLANPGYQFFLPESPSNKRFLNGASTTVLHIPSVDVVGNLSNEDSSTYLLIRKRPGHSLDTNGMSVYGPEYAWKKDVNPDVDYNSRLDFGDEHTFGIPIYPGNGLEGTQSTALMMEPVQIVDELAWSNNSGKEYNVPGRGINSGEISDSPNFNPDSAARVRYMTQNPLVGSRISGSGELRPTTLADESWIYGETLNVDPGTSDYGVFKPLYEPGLDMILGTADDELNHLAPTDPDGRLYSYDGPGDDNPMLAPFLEYSPAVDALGILLFEPYDISGFRLTPGSMNDAPVGSLLAATPIGTQFRFIRGDVNFDGVVDFADYTMISESIGMTLDDQSTLTRDRNTDDPDDDLTYTGWTHQLSGFNSVLAMVRMDLTDGTTGEWDSGNAVTEADAMALHDLVPQCSIADLAEVYGELDFFDISAFLTMYSTHDAAVDFNSDGSFDFFDIVIFLDAYTSGCP